MRFQFVTPGSREWHEARELRHASFFRPLGLPLSVMDDDEEPNGAHLVALIDGGVVGYGRLFDLGAGEFHLSQLVVAPDHRGKGIGSALLRALVGKARNDGGAVVKLAARVTAVSFYKAAGFHQVGDVFPSGKTGIPHVNMVLDIDRGEA